MNIHQPTLLVNESICRNNIRIMANKAKASQCIFRPHFKTHQSARIAEWFRDEGVSKITVSSVTMAEYFISHGWTDVLIAFPFNILEIDNVNDLAQNANVHVTVESAFTIELLAQQINQPVGIYIKIDAGYHRTGLDASNQLEIERILHTCSSSQNLTFKGFLAHFGNTYQARHLSEVRKIYEDSIEPLKSLKKKYIKRFPELLISIGDTPSCSRIDDLSDADEIRPGNFIFYDLMQLQLGSCRFEDIAVALLCPVVAKHPNRNEVILYGGTVHLSKESVIHETVNPIYGRVVKLLQNGWSQPLSNTFVSRISQEHGIIQCAEDVFNNIQIGEVLGIIPVHACITANLHNTYITTDGQLINNIHTQR
jgi:D-serine deaminase-like pyridoxal phosphate-dependent protein